MNNNKYYGDEYEDNIITYDDIGDNNILTWSAREARRAQLLPGVEDEMRFSNYLYNKFIQMLENEKNKFDSLILLYDVYLQEVLKALTTNSKSILLLKCLIYLLDAIKNLKKTSLFNQLSSELKLILFNNNGIPYYLLQKYQKLEYQQIKSLVEKKDKNLNLLYCITKTATQFDYSIDMKLLKLTFYHWKQYTKDCKLLLKSQYNARLNPDDYRAQRFAFHAWLTTAKHEKCINSLQEHASVVEVKVNKMVIEVENSEQKFEMASNILSKSEAKLNEKKQLLHEKEINAQLFTLKSFEQSIISTALDLLLKEVELLRKEFPDRPGLSLFMLASNSQKCLHLQNEIAVIESQLESNGFDQQLVVLHDKLQADILEAESQAWIEILSLPCDEFLNRWILSFNYNHDMKQNEIINNNDVFHSSSQNDIQNDDNSDNNNKIDDSNEQEEKEEEMNTNNNDNNNKNDNTNKSDNNNNSDNSNKSDNNDKNDNNKEVNLNIKKEQKLPNLFNIYKWLNGIFNVEWSAFINNYHQTNGSIFNNGDSKFVSSEDAVNFIDSITSFLSSKVSLAINIKPNIFLKLHESEIMFNNKEDHINPLMFMTEIDDDKVNNNDTKQVEENHKKLAKQFHHSMAALCFLARPYANNEIKSRRMSFRNTTNKFGLNKGKQNTLGLRRSSIVAPSNSIFEDIKSTAIEFRSLNGRLLRLQRIWALVAKNEYDQDEARPQVLNTLLSVRRSLECVVKLHRQRRTHLDMLHANIREYSLELSENLNIFDIKKVDRVDNLLHTKLKANQIKDLNIDFNIISKKIDQHIDALSSVYKYYASLNNISYGVITLSSFMVFVKDIGLNNSGTLQVLFTRSCRRVDNNNNNYNNSNNDNNSNNNNDKIDNQQQRSLNESGFFEAVVRLSCHFNIDIEELIEIILERASSLTVGSFIHNMENSLVQSVFLAFRKYLKKLYEKYCRKSIKSTLSRDNFVKLMRDISMIGYQNLTEHTLNNLFSEIMFIPKIVNDYNEITYEGFLYALSGCAEYCNPNPFEEAPTKIQHFLECVIEKLKK